MATMSVIQDMCVSTTTLKGLAVQGLAKGGIEARMGAKNMATKK